MTKITMIGAGNLATHISRALSSSEFEIVQIYSRTKHSASRLAEEINVPYTTDVRNIKSSDLAIIAINDDSISEIEKHVTFPKVHTSGTQPMSVLKGDKVGVFYPLQTFNKTLEVDFNTIPICLETNNSELNEIVTLIAKAISNKVIHLNSKQRKHLHLAAVMACNFSNLMYQFSQEICVKENIPFDILRPLILETANKVQANEPQMTQTGPAKRGDLNTIEEHIMLLETEKEKLNIYQLLTESIKSRS